jgi:hypothetical protein
MTNNLPIGGPVDHGHYQNFNFVIESVSTLPTATSGDIGRVVQLSTDGNLYICDTTPAYRLLDARNAATANTATTAGTATTAATATNANNLNSQPASFYTNFANTTGSRTHSAISDFDTQATADAQAVRLDQFAAPTSAVNINSQRLTAVGNPSTGTDGANKSYVDSAVAAAQAGIDVKANVQTVAVTNITLNGLITVNGYTVQANDRVLVTAQSTATQNGVYLASSGSWARVTPQEENPGSFWYIQQGSSAGQQWICNNATAVTIGTTAVSIIQFGAQTVYHGTASVAIDGSNNISATAASGGGISTTSGIAVDNTVSRSYSVAVPAPGSGTAVTITSPVTPPAGRRLMVQVYRNSDNALVMCYVSNATGSASITLDFGTAPVAGQYTAEIRS